MKFSIIMPAYNCEKYITQAIDSVLFQTYTNFELIIINDGSTDSTFDICKKKSENDPRISCYTLNHAGVSAARNYGISKASGDYLLFIDCDDFWQYDLLSICNNYIDEHNTLLLFGIKENIFTSDDVFLSYKNQIKNNTQPFLLQLEGNPDSYLKNYNFSSPCNKIYKKQIIIDNNILFDNKCVYLEDLKFNLDYMIHISDVKIISENLYNYRIFADQKQIKKRKFKNAFENSDALFESASTFAAKQKIALAESVVLSAIAINTYFNEYLYSENRDLRLLNSNKGFNTLLKAAKGKYFALMKLTKKLRLYSIQKTLIERRY